MLAITLCALTLHLGLSINANAQSLDELLDLEPAQSTPKQSTPKPTDPQTESTDDSVSPDTETTPPTESSATDESKPDALARELEQLRQKNEAEYEQATNAFEQAVLEMNTVAERLADHRDASLETQRMQEDIIKKLDQMVAAARKQAQQSSSPSSASPSQSDPQPGEAEQQSQDSTNAASSPTNPSQGQASPGSVTHTTDTDQPLEELKKEWGQLPPRLRDELTEGLGERFSPVYRLMTEAYYRRLAEDAAE